VASTATASNDITSLICSTASAVQNLSALAQTQPRAAIEGQPIYLVNGNSQPVNLTGGDGSLVFAIVFFVAQL
jgi:hypothetical protein